MSLDEKKKQQQKFWVEKNRDEHLRKKREWYYKNKERQLQSQQKRNRKEWYGLEHDDYLKLLEDQHHVCAICGNVETARNPSGKIKPLSVDHCHKTGKVRGLLCRACNTLLGNAKDDVDVLISAISYLKGSW